MNTLQNIDSYDKRTSLLRIKKNIKTRTGNMTK